MKEFSGWQALFLSFWSPQLYRDVAKYWQGTGYTYLFLVLCATSILYCVKMQILANNIFDAMVLRVLLQVPDITCTNGEISIGQSSPYTIYAPGPVRRPFIVFDMSDKDFSDKPEMTMSEALRVEKHGVWAKKPVAGTRGMGADYALTPIKLEPDTNFSITKQAVMTGGRVFKNLFGAIAFLVIVPMAFLVAIIQTLVYALAGYVTSRLLGLSLSFMTLVRLASVCLTPIILVDSIKRILNREVPNFEALAALIILGYMIFALYSNRDTAVTLKTGEST
jgi:Protein of unknown function (DUF1189)